MNGKNSFDSEGAFIRPKEKEVGLTMANGGVRNSNVNWTIIRDVAQYLIYPILCALIYLVLQNSAFDRRLSIIEITTSRPVVDIESVRKIAVIEDRQNRNIMMITDLKAEVDKHRDMSTYDNPIKRR